MVYNMNQEVRMALTSLIDGTFDPDTNLFRELYDALLNGCGGRADEYFVLEDYAFMHAHSGTSTEPTAMRKNGCGWQFLIRQRAVNFLLTVPFVSMPMKSGSCLR